MLENIQENIQSEDDILHIRERYHSALRAGLSTADATAYANGSDPTEPWAPVTGPPKSMAELATVPGDEQNGTTIITTAATPSLTFCHRSKVITETLPPIACPIMKIA
jgi:hypothetical protein